MAKKKEESTNEKIVRLYKEGYTFDEISRSMSIPKGNVIGIVEKYFPDYQAYKQPQIDHAALEEKETEKSSKGGFPWSRGKKEHAPEPVDPAKLTVNLEMDENGFIDRTVQGIAQMLKKRSVAETAEFFNKEKADIQAIYDCMDEHFRRQEAAAAAKEAPAAEEPEEEEPVTRGRREDFPTGIEPEKPKSPRSKYSPPVYTKRTDPKPVSASYGLASDDKPVQAEEEKASTEPKFKPSIAVPVEETPAAAEEETGHSVSLLETEEETSTIDLSATEPESHSVKLVPDEDGGSDTAEEEHKVSLVDDAVEEVPEIPSIEPVSAEALESKLQKAPEPVEEIPAISAATYSADAERSKEEDSGMSPVEKMRQFAQEQIALNNQKIDELKSKKTDAENNAFDCNTKVEQMKKKIEEMQQELLQLISSKDAAAKIVSELNDEIEAINQENAEYGKYI